TTFAVAYVLNCGMTASLAGVMVAVYTLCAFAGQLLFGALSDRLGRHKPVFLCGVAALILCNLLFYFHPTGAGALVFYGMIGLLQQPMGVAMDTWVLKSYSTGMFGRARACSTFGFALLMPLQGWLIGRIGYVAMPILSTGIGLGTLALALTLPETRGAARMQRTGGGFASLAHLPTLLFLLPVLFLMGVANAPQIQLTALIVSNVGGTVAWQSYVMCVNSIVQSPIMMLSGRLSRIAPQKRLMFAIGSCMMAITGILLARTPSALLLCYAFNGLGTGMYLPAMRQLIAEQAPAGLQTTAQGMADATYSSLAGMVSMMFSGVLADRYGSAAMECVALSFQVLALLCLTLYMRKNKTRAAARVPE
ncbi:MAG: MFS transporter, partial [Eubacteriales bacterium]|nr:MFS transporter [Eubacteriales bacterium]